MIDTQHRHGGLFVLGRCAGPVFRVAEGLGDAPERFLWAPELRLEEAHLVEAGGYVGEVVDTGAVVAAAAAVGAVAFGT